jgi:hypothetical protein
MMAPMRRPLLVIAAAAAVTLAAAHLLYQYVLLGEGVVRFTLL